MATWEIALIGYRMASKNSIGMIAQVGARLWYISYEIRVSHEMSGYKPIPVAQWRLANDRKGRKSPITSFPPRLNRSIAVSGKQTGQTSLNRKRKHPAPSSLGISHPATMAMPRGCHRKKTGSTRPPVKVGEAARLTPGPRPQRHPSGCRKKLSRRRAGSAPGTGPADFSSGRPGP